MPDRARALELAERTLRFCTGADQAQAIVTLEDSAYSRFARNYVTQNIDATAPTVEVTFVREKRLGIARTRDLSEAGLRGAVDAAREITGRLPVNPEFVSLATPAPIAAAPKSTFASTANATADDRVARLLTVFERMKRSKLNASGFTTTAASARAVANSLGVRASFDETMSGLEIKAMAPDVSGYAQYWSRDYATTDAAERADLAATKATVSAEPADLAPGTYTVILEPSPFLECITQVLDAMDAERVLETQDSWMIDRIDKAIFSPNLTVVDDWSFPLMANAPFARDGAPTQKVTLIERGVPKNYVTSTYLANKFKKPNTGHSDNYPTNAVVLPGTKSRAQLIAETERGVLISRMWYTRVVNPRECTITGLTRDGVYLIENGKLTKTLKNFRVFTSMLTALSDVELGNRLFLAESSEAPVLHAVPDAKIAKFTLAAQTSFA
jgi:PmbA protein